MSYNKIYIRNNEIIDISEIQNMITTSSFFEENLSIILKFLKNKCEYLEDICNHDYLNTLNEKDLISNKFKLLAALNVKRNVEDLKTKDFREYFKTYMYKGIFPFSILELDCPYNLYFFREGLLPMNHYGYSYNFPDVISHKISHKMKCLFVGERTRWPNSIFRKVINPLIVNKNEDDLLLDVSESYINKGIKEGYEEICNWFKNLMYIIEKTSHKIDIDPRIIKSEEIIRKHAEEVWLTKAKNNNYLENKGNFIMNIVDSWHSSSFKFTHENEKIFHEIYGIQTYIDELIGSLKDTDYKIYE